MRRLLLGATLLGFAAACGHSTLESSPTLDITLGATPTTATHGDTVTFVASARGGLLIGIEIDYADGNTDQYPTSGARSASVTFRHAFAAAGSYSVRATATDAGAGQKDATVLIHIN